MADSLEANFALDSDSEQAVGGPSSSSSRPTGSKINGNGTKTSGTKRRAQDDDDDDDDDDDSDDVQQRGAGEEVDAMKLAAGAASAQKKARRKARTKARKARMALAQEELLASSSSSNNPALLPASSQVDFLRKEMRKAPAWRDLSEIEIGERGVREDEVVETIAWKGGRDLLDLCAFVKRFATLPPPVNKDKDEEEDEGDKSKGAPSVLVLTNNALRAAHIARELRNLLPGGSTKEAAPPSGKPNKAKRQKGEETKEGTTGSNKEEDASTTVSASTQQPLQIAKLFSRHFTPAQQVSFLATHRVLAGAGTPQRIALLLSKPREIVPDRKKGEAEAVGKLEGDGDVADSAQAFALDVSRLTTLVLDAGWKDEKTRSLLDEQGAREGLVEIWEKVRERKGMGQVKVILF